MYDINLDLTSWEWDLLTPEGLSPTEEFYWRIANDFPWYAENFLKIRDKGGNIVPFKLNKPQMILWKSIYKDIVESKPRRYIILKARQMGFSTVTEALLFWITSTVKNTNTLILAHEVTASFNLFNMSKTFYELLPPELRPMKKKDNGRLLTFENPDDNDKDANPGLRSKFTVATAGAGEVGRSFTGSLIHISEMAFFQSAKKTLTGLLQTMPSFPNTMVVIESTANGVGDFFHQEWGRAVKEESDYTPLFFAWFQMPDYTLDFNNINDKSRFMEEVNYVSYDLNNNPVYTDEKTIMDRHGLTYEQMHWRRWTIRNKCHGDVEMFYQEYPSTPEEAFVASGRPVFSIPVLREYLANVEDGVRGYLDEDSAGVVSFREDAKGYIEVWRKPNRNKHYCIGADVAEGLAEGDYSCAVVGDSEFSIDAMWHGHIDPDLFAKEIEKLGKYYNGAYVGVEANNHGMTVLRGLQRLEYWDLYFQKTMDRITDKMTQKVGWTTSPKTKPIMIDKLAQFVREKYLRIKSHIIINEAFTYVKEDNGATNGQTGCHDDTIMAMAVLLQVLLEGRGIDYKPEVPYDAVEKNKNLSSRLRHVDTPKPLKYNDKHTGEEFSI